MENLAITFEIQKFLLVFFRVAAVIFMVPVFSARMVSGIFKGGLSLLIAYLLFDVIDMQRDKGNRMSGKHQLFLL